MSYETECIQLADKQDFPKLVKIYMESASQAISSIIKSKIEIYDPKVEEVSLNQVQYSILEPVVFVKSCLTSNAAGTTMLVFRQRDVQIFLNELMGIDELPEPDFEFDEVALSATNEVMNQMMKTSVAALAEYLSCTMESADVKSMVGKEDQELAQVFGEEGDRKVLTITYKIMIQEMIESEFIQILSLDAAQSICEKVEAKEEKEKLESKEESQLSASGKADILVGTNKQSGIIGQAGAGRGTRNTGEAPEMPYQSNINLIMDVPLNVSVEVGKTKRKLKDILGFNNGTVVELEKQADAPADIIVNGQLIARGDVLVIDDNFGVRITEIINTKNIIGNGEMI